MITFRKQIMDWAESHQPTRLELHKSVQNENLFSDFILGTYPLILRKHSKLSSDFAPAGALEVHVVTDMKPGLTVCKANFQSLNYLLRPHFENFYWQKEN